MLVEPPSPPERRGPLLAAAIAALAAAPSLWLPFISDDWMHTLFADQGIIRSTPFDFFRPLCNLSYWMDWQLWGLTPAPFHLTNVILASAAAALVAVLARRYTGDATVGAIAGVLFALHPYHVGAIAWISARSDLLSAVLLLLAAWAYERWRERAAALPVAALLLYEIAMLAKEGAVVLPGVLIVLGLFGRRRATRGEWIRGYLPLMVLGVLHFTLVRAALLGGISLNHLKWISGWKGNLLSYGVAGIVPPPPEVLHQHPWLWGALAVGVTASLLLVAYMRTRRIPAAIWPAALVFVALLGPSMIGFQQRYYFLPGAAAAVALAVLLRSAGPRLGSLFAVLLLGGWMATGVELWTGWFVAGRASGRLMDGLVAASLDPGVEMLVPVGIPHRVHGVPVTTDYTRAVPFLGGREVVIRTATEFDFPSDRDDALAGSREAAVHNGSEAVEFLLTVPGGRPYSRHVLPLFPEAESRVVTEWATIVRQGPATMQVRVPYRERTLIYLWVDGDLEAVRR